MAWGDKDRAGVAVIALFDDEQQTRAPRGKAVELLKEVPPNATVTRVAQGRSAILATGDERSSANRPGGSCPCSCEEAPNRGSSAHSVMRRPSGRSKR